MLTLRDYIDVHGAAKTRAAADLDANARKLEGLSETHPPFLRRLCDGKPSEPNNSQRVTRDLPPDRRRQVIDLDVRFPLL